VFDDEELIRTLICGLFETAWGQMLLIAIVALIIAAIGWGIMETV
jgi:hypothetical protein